MCHNCKEIIGKKLKTNQTEIEWQMCSLHHVMMPVLDNFVQVLLHALTWHTWTQKAYF